MTASTLNTYWYLLRRFRNGFSLIQNLRHGGYESCGPISERLVLRDGRTIVHPANRGGLVPVMLEMWRENVYRLGEFYQPKAGEVVVDVGAHIGLFTLQVLWEEPRCRVVGLEPSAENFACLKQNLVLAGVGAQVEIHQLGIGGEFGRIKMLEIPTNRSVDARVTPALETEPGTVGVVPLRHLFELAKSNEIALLKMDAEGGEYGAFGNAEPELFERIERIVMEYHDNYVPGTLAMLQEKLSATHDLTVFPDAGQLHGRLFAVRKDACKYSKQPLPADRASTAKPSCDTSSQARGEAPVGALFGR
jgi:FkbM family methyltransferase